VLQDISAYDLFRSSSCNDLTGYLQISILVKKIEGWEMDHAALLVRYLQVSTYPDDRFRIKDLMFSHVSLVFLVQEVLKCPVQSNAYLSIRRIHRGSRILLPPTVPDKIRSFQDRLDGNGVRWEVVVLVKRFGLPLNSMGLSCFAF
jgi:hypothetical protein